MTKKKSHTVILLCQTSSLEQTFILIRNNVVSEITTLCMLTKLSEQKNEIIS